MATLNILYEDPHILVCVKPHGIATQSKSIRYPDMVSLIKNHLAKASGTSGKSGAPKSIGSRTPGSAEPYLAVIHRLDQPVAGILVFAKTPAAAKDLNKQLQNQGFGKYYRALVANTPSTKEGTLENYMVKDARTNTSRICSAKENGSKIARLHYDTVPVTDWLFTAPAAFHGTELEIHLDTGRHHQIRVQMAYHGMPLYGDMKYGVPVGTAKLDKKENADQGTMKAAGNRNMPGIRTAGNMGSGRESIALCASSLNFFHPVTKKEMTFEIEPVGGAFQLFQV